MKNSFFDVLQPLFEYIPTRKLHRDSVKLEEPRVGTMVSRGGASENRWILYAFVQEMVSRICWKVEYNP